MLLDPLSFFSEYIERETGIIFRDSNLYQLKSRLEDIIKNEKIASLDELMKKFQGFPGQDLKTKLLDQSTNNETLFFRDPTFFLALEQFLIKEILPHNPKEIKIWSAASSTGQECLSTAMVLEEISKKIPLPNYSILATDISERALTKARTGVYSDFEVTRGLSDERKKAHFDKVADGWKVKDSIKNKIQYRYNNLLRPSVDGKFHLILCRNVLIYQKLEMKKTIVESLFGRLENEGGILLGVGETLLGIVEKVDPTMMGNVVVYRNRKDIIKKVS